MQLALCSTLYFSDINFISDDGIQFQISDDTNQAKGFAVIGTCGGVARLLVSIESYISGHPRESAVACIMSA